YVVNTDNAFNKIKGLLHHRPETLSPQWLKAISFYLNDLYHQYTSQYFALRGSIKTKKKAQSDLQDKITEHKQILSQLQKADQREFTPKDLKDLDKVYKLSQTIYDSLILDNIPVETIRQLIKRIYVKPLEARTKVFIINGLEWMKEEGSNTFLKAIEEPPPQNVIILITERVDLILPTIRSRCFQLPFQPLNLHDQQVLVTEKLGLGNIIQNPSARNLWDHLKETDRSNQADQLVRDFYQTVAVNYQKGNALFYFIDRILEHCDLNEFFYALFDTFRMAKRVKYGVQTLDENTNPLYLLPDKAIDKLVQEGEDLLPKIITFNLNPSLALTAYLMKVSRLLLSARRK
ncbi:MAG TPA: DNA polymerase III subunit delta', partial [Spirochaetes bacterium]|nr:DNA polymerase III subunit delta' [Spirochaetota bacterium]